MRLDNVYSSGLGYMSVTIFLAEPRGLGFESAV